jgi:geranylgeranyl diphosphate synthase type I
MALALSRATAAQRDVLLRVGTSVLSDTDVAQVQQVIVECGALKEMETTIERLTNQAVDAISAAPVDSSVRTELVNLAHVVSNRRV